MSQDMQETKRVTRKSLKTLQHAAADIENLVGRPTKTLHHQLTQEPTVGGSVVEAKRKLLSTQSKETQANLDPRVTVKDLTDPKGASENYWQILAEKRQVDLQDALNENEKLRKIIDDLKEENSLIKQMLEEANSFVEVIKEELANTSNNDTGIDVNDVSTADETADDANVSTPTDNND